MRKIVKIATLTGLLALSTWGGVKLPSILDRDSWAYEALVGKTNRPETMGGLLGFMVVASSAYIYSMIKKGRDDCPLGGSSYVPPDDDGHDGESTDYRGPLH